MPTAEELRLRRLRKQRQTQEAATARGVAGLPPISGARRRRMAVAPFEDIRRLRLAEEKEAAGLRAPREVLERPELAPQPEPGIGRLFGEEVLRTPRVVARAGARHGEALRRVLPPSRAKEIALGLTPIPYLQSEEAQRLGGVGRRVLGRAAELGQEAIGEAGRLGERIFARERAAPPVTPTVEPTPATAVAPPEVAPEAEVGRRIVPAPRRAPGRVLPAGGPWYGVSPETYGAQRATTQARLLTGIGSTREAQARVVEQARAEQARREGLGAKVTIAKEQAGAARGEAERETARGREQLLSQEVQAAIRAYQPGDPASEARIVEAQQRIAEFRGGAVTPTPEPEAGAITDIATQAPAGTAPIPEGHEAAYDELKKDYETAGFDIGRMSSRDQRAWSELKKRYPYLTLPKQQRA